MTHRPIPNSILLAVTVAGLAGGLAAQAFGLDKAAAVAWMASTTLVLVSMVAAIIADLRRRAFGVDVVAALAMAGALALGQPLTGAVIALMFASGGALEDYAERRSRRDLTALLARVPRVAHRRDGDRLEDIAADLARRGDRLLVKAGELVPADGVIVDGIAVLDESALTGEALPVTRRPGEQVRSGTVNAGDPFEFSVLSAAAESTYAGIVRLVETAAASKAPFVRLADRAALLFVPFTLAVAGLAYLVSADPLRALAVLVVATPCPLILAVPVAIIAGIARAARRGVVIKTGGALETLARARVVMFDKTGTLTSGAARLADVAAAEPFTPDGILRMAASLDQTSPHVLAAALVGAARERNLALSLPSAVSEQPGAGIQGTVDGCAILVGGFDWIGSRVAMPALGRHVLRRMAHEGLAGVFVAIDGHFAGAVLLADEIRPESAAALRALRRAGAGKIVMVSGDRAEIAETIAAALGIDAVLAERTPADKVAAVAAERAEAITVMVGDGINDAPALAAADVGVALGARGAAASSEAADVVLLVDRLDRLAEAMAIARRSRTIAVECVAAGMGLSILAMAAAAAGWLAPVAGAVLQEAIDVAVILNALRALGPVRPWARKRRLTPTVATRLSDQHRDLMRILDRIRAVADRIDLLESEDARNDLAEIQAMLRDRLLPHEKQDDARLYPALAEMVGGDDPLAGMSRTHREIMHLARLFDRMVADFRPGSPDPDERRELRRILYGLGAILNLHFAQEEELFRTLSA